MKTQILIVDDDAAILSGVSLLLEQAGYAALGAGTASEALRLLAGPDYPQLIILDLMLPDGDGYQVCRRIREISPYIPTIMLSARDQLDDKLLGLEIGADDYITKPFEPSELLARVRATLRFAAERAGAPQREDQPLVIGPIRIWKARRRLEVNGATVALTAKEWLLLELFVDHPRQVFGRETLLRQIWGYDYLGDSRVVDVQIQRLRAKLEVDPVASGFIQTVRGFGYRFEPAP